MSASDLTQQLAGGPIDRLPISFNQEFTCLFDHGDEEGLFGPRNHIVHGWWVTGDVDTGTLRAALDDLVRRHTMLRAQVVRDQGDPYLRIYPPSPPPVREISCTDVPAALRRQRTEELLNEVEASAIGVTELPHLRAVLARFGPEESLLVLIVHHTATDGWSMRLIIRDLATCYAARRGYGTQPPPPVQYHEYAAWQRGLASDEHSEAARFWRDKLAGAGISTFTTDRPHSRMPETTSGVYRFHLDADLVRRTLALARATRSTPFMVFLSAFELLIHELKATTDIVIPTFSPGRDDVRFHQTVGPFFNFLPLRTDIAGCETFRHVLERTRVTCLESYLHDIPAMRIFQEAPALMDPGDEDDQTIFVFQVFPFPFVLDEERVGDLVYTEVRWRLLPQPVGSDVPDGALWTLNVDPTGNVLGSVHFKTGLFDQASIGALVARYSDVLRAAVAAPDAALSLSP